jgi:VanZ family protein
VALWALLILAGTSVPAPALPPLLPGVPRSDKLVHGAMYLVLAVLLVRALRREHPGRRGVLLILMATGLAAAFGLFDEWHQQFIVTRMSSWQDWLADAIGALIGATAATLIHRRRTGDQPMPDARRVSGTELEQELTDHDLCVVEFWMVGCPACARFAVTFGELAQELEGRANVVAIEARENMDASKKYAIRGVPSVIVFKQGEEVQRTTGAKTLDEMREWLEPVLS